MSKLFICLTSIYFFLFISTSRVSAQNKFGVHILDPQEIVSAARLVNSNGGDWGYVTIPIRSTDKDLKKWQYFMDQAKSLHLIPIVRLATYGIGETWVQPTHDDVVDFSNFLFDLDWPVQQKLVIAFNEPNHAYEWGGQVNPAHYASILDFAIRRFEQLDPSFVVLPAALDASVPTSKTSLSQYQFLSQMFSQFPALASNLQAWNSHSYPNPAFSGLPKDTHAKSIYAFTHELRFLSRYTSKPLPVYITETGWQMDTLDPKLVSRHYQTAFATAWADSRVVAVTPFLLNAHAGQFAKFSLITPTGDLTLPAQALMGIPKLPNTPLLALTSPSFASLPISSVSSSPRVLGTNISNLDNFKSFLQKLFELFQFGKKYQNLQIGNVTIRVEIADTPIKRSQGLSGRKSLGLHQGMLFVFPNAQAVTFWMKDMHFPLDFIWIRDNRIVAISQDIPPASPSASPPLISPQTFVDQVLEVNSGFVVSQQIKIGDPIILK